MTSGAATGAGVHSRLAWWAASRSSQMAIDDGQQCLTFADLQAAVEAQLQHWNPAGHTVLLSQQAHASPLSSLVEFLGIVASGRCAAVGDPDWPAPTWAAIAERIQQLPPSSTSEWSARPFYIGFTSGSSGLPKGFRRHHRSWLESFQICAQTFGPDSGGTVLAPGRVSHSLFLFGMLFGLWSGGGTVVQERFSAARTLETLEQGLASVLVVVPSQLLMLLEWQKRRPKPPILATRLILISGARWMREHTPALQALFPQAKIIEFYGASETSFIAWQAAAADIPYEVVGKPFANVDITIRKNNTDADNGLIYVRSPMLFMDYVGAATDATAAIRDGDWLSVRDMGHMDAQGRLCLAGRENRMIVTQGKNLFPDEVETVLLQHPTIAQVSVQSLPDPIRGQQVVAILQFKAQAVNALALQHWCRTQLEPYKIPKRFWLCSNWPYTRSGKTDLPALQRQLEQAWREAESVTCLHKLL